MTFRVAVLASGRGSNFEVLADRIRKTRDPAARPREGSSPIWEVALLLTDREGIPVLERAQERGIPGQVIPPDADRPETVPERMLESLSEAQVDLVVLAGYLRLVPAPVVSRFRGRMLNIHPALLPSFGGQGMYGRRVHEAVIASGARVSGVTVHLVDEEYDRGRILAQWPVPVLPSDDPDSLAERIHQIEHWIYPTAVDELARAVSEGREPSPIPRDGLHFHLGPLIPGSPGTGEPEFQPGPSS